MLLSAILLSDIKSIDFSWRWKYIADYVLCELQSISNLKVLKYTKHKNDYDNYDVLKYHNNDKKEIRLMKVGVGDIMKALRSLTHLEHLTLESKCTNAMLEVLSKT
jgi:hypothetical protein